MMNKIRNGLAIILSLAFYLTASFSCTDTEVIDKRDFAIYYPSMVDIGPSMIAVIGAPAYIGEAPHDFEITKVTLDEELYNNQSFIIDVNTGAISIENTSGIPVGLYKLSVKCISAGKTYEFADIVDINMMRPVPDGISVEPNKIIIDYADVIDEESGVELPTAQVKTDGNHVSITRYEIANSEFSKFFAISSTGEISVVRGSSELQPGKYSLSLKLKTGASADDEGIFENAVEFDITSKPLALTYEPNSGIIEEESAENPITTYTSTKPLFKGSKDDLKFSIKTTPSTNKILIDESTGVISIKGGHGLTIGDKYVIDVNVKNKYATEGVDFENVFELEVVDFIEPIKNFSYEDVTALQAVAFEANVANEFKGDEVRFEFVDLPEALQNDVSIDYKGTISAAKGNKIPLGKHTVKVKATNPKSDESAPTIATFTITVEPNPNVFTYVRYGNNLGLTPVQNYANQFRIKVGGSLSDINPTPETDAKVELFYEIKNIHGVGGTTIDPLTGEISLSSLKVSQTGAAMVTATAGKGTPSEFSIETPVFFHYASEVGPDKVSIEYSPFVLQANPKTGARSVSPVAKNVNDMSKLIMDYRRTFNYYSFTEAHNDGQPSAVGSLMNNLWNKYGESINKAPNYGSKDPISYYSNESNLNNALLYVDGENHQIVINPNKWIHDGVFANGIFSGQITFVTDGDVSKVNNGTQIFPILIWFDSNF